MILHIDTTQNEKMEIALREKGKVLARKIVAMRHNEAEKLLLAIDKLLKVNKLTLKDIKGIEVENVGGSFTSLRIGVITANALGYALGVPVKGVKSKKLKVKSKKFGFDIIEPIYDREPSITTKKAF